MSHSEVYTRCTQVCTFIGIDPGYSAGGLVVLNNDTVEVAAGWQKLRRKSGDVWRVDVEKFGDQLVMERVYFGTFWEIIDALWGSIIRSPYHLAIEQPFIPRRGLNGLINLIEAAGGLMAVWAPGALSTCRPTANEWRSAVLGITSRVKAKDAERKAIEWVKKRMNLGTLQDNGHVAEAAVIAFYLQSNAHLR